MQSIDDKKHSTKFLNLSSIVSPIPKKIFTNSNHDNIQNKTSIRTENVISNNCEDILNNQRFIFHKNSAFRYLNKAKELSILLRNSFCLQ